MQKHILSILLVTAIAILQVNQGRAIIAQPTLKWQWGGCYNSWCETGWYSSPAVLDIDADGINEVIGSAYSIVALDGSTGSLVWRVNSGHDRSEQNVENVGRTWPSIVAADINHDGEQEIITAHGGGYVSVYDRQGYFLPGWPQQPVANELRGLIVTDLDGDDFAEITVSAARSSKTNTWVYGHDGTLRTGWPQLDNDLGYAWGVYNDNAAAGDLDNDGILELIIPSDVHYICAYHPDATPLSANTIYRDKKWGKVGIWEDLSVEIRGWGACDGTRSESYRTNFAHGAAVVADIDGDAVPEVIAVGSVYDCSSTNYQSKYNGVYIFNGDRSRFTSSGYDWQLAPTDTGAPLEEDYNVIENNLPNPVVADLDGDGEKEILFSSYDGRLHAYWLDKTEHHNWPYSIYQAAEGFYRYGSEPVVADLDNDGLAEVIFSSWTQKGSNAGGRLHIVDHQGNMLYELTLPPSKSTSSSITWNGALAAPLLANIDDDADLELVLNTAFSGFVAYDLPGTSEARILWGAGRAGRIYHKPALSDTEILQRAILTLQILTGRTGPVSSDSDRNGVTEMADVLSDLHSLLP